MIKAIKGLLDGMFGDDAPALDQDKKQTVQLACAALLIEVMKADKELKPEEEAAIIEAIRNTWNIPTEELNSLMQKAFESNTNSISLYEFTHKVNDHLDHQQKYELIKAMWSVAYSDGELDKYEESLIRQVSELIHVPHVQFIKAKKETQELN